jgi:hypothetical protein
MNMPAPAGGSNTRKLAIKAGSPLDWAPPEGAPRPERTLEGLIELRRDAGSSVSA